MAKKYIILFITLVFFLGTLGMGLCLTSNSKATPNCCPSKNSFPVNSEDCLSHCARQKVNTLKIELFRVEESKIKKKSFPDTKSFHTLQNDRPNHNFSQNLYLNKATPKFNISQVYFLAIFNHAPPPAF